jgi:hypothetical protein
VNDNEQFAEICLPPKKSADRLHEEYVAEVMRVMVASWAAERGEDNVSHDPTAKAGGVSGNSR